MSEQALSIWNRFRALPSRLLTLAIGMGILGWAYWPNLQGLYTVWSQDPNYSHGILVFPIALVIFWQRLADAKDPWTATNGPWWGWAILVAILAVRAYAYEGNNLWIESATLIPSVACLLLTLGGWPLFQRGWPAAVFLVFMLPLPHPAHDMIAVWLQRIVTLGSVFVMRLTGLKTVADENVITLHDHANALKTLEVTQFYGLSMLTTLTATVTAIIMLFPLAHWKRFVVLASTLPISLACSIALIVATGWSYYYIDGVAAMKTAHEWTLYMQMPLALVPVGIEVRALSWLVNGGRSS